MPTTPVEMMPPNFGSTTKSMAKLNSMRNAMPNSSQTSHRNTQRRIKSTPGGLAVAGYLVSNTDESRAFQAVDALQEQADFWRPAYTALVGVYYLSKQPRISQAFQQMMGATHSR